MWPCTKKKTEACQGDVDYHICSQLLNQTFTSERFCTFRRAQVISEKKPRHEEENNKHLRFDVDLDRLAEVAFVRSLFQKVTLLSPPDFSLSPLEGSYDAQSHLGNVELCSRFLQEVGVLG